MKFLSRTKQDKINNTNKITVYHCINNRIEIKFYSIDEYKKLNGKLDDLNLLAGRFPTIFEEHGKFYSLWDGSGIISPVDVSAFDAIREMAHKLDYSNAYERVWIAVHSLKDSLNMWNLLIICGMVFGVIVGLSFSNNM